MNDKKDDSKIGGVKSTKETKNVDAAKEVSDVDRIKGAASVGSVGGIDGASKRRPTRTMSLEEREELFKMVKEEAGNLFGKAGVPQEKQDLLEEAVKMAIDSGLLPEELAEEGKKPKKR